MKTYEEFERREADVARAREELRLSRIKGHAVVGAVVFAALQFAFGVVSLRLEGALIGAAVGAPLGAVAGWWISSRHLDLAGGALTGGLLVAAVDLAWGACSSDGLSVARAVGALGAGLLAGGIPGIFVAYHCQQDRC